MPHSFDFSAKKAASWHTKCKTFNLKIEISVGSKYNYLLILKNTDNTKTLMKTT
jgi:hypothetical protein